MLIYTLCLDMNDSRVGDDHPPVIYPYPYDEDSDLESDFDEDPPAVPGLSDSIPIEALSPPIQIPELDTAQPGSPKSPSGKTLSVASIFDVDTDLPFEHSPAESLRSHVDSECFGMSDSICISEDQQAVSPTCDVVDEPMGRCAEEYQADKVKSQEKIFASLPRLALVNDVAFRTYVLLHLCLHNN